MDASVAAPGKRVRRFREDAKISLDRLADMIAERGIPRPSIAKLSRIETESQPIPTDILPALAAITGISARELRPDLAGLFVEAAE